MFIGHLPTAYLALKPFQRRVGAPAFAAGLVGSVLPDIDLILFYFVDGRAFHHHEYLTHRPVLWGAILLFGLAILSLRRPAGVAVVLLGLGGLIHMLLDSIAGSIAWGWPVFSTSLTLVIVPATHDNWILSFLNHWTFKVELMLCALAALVWARV